MAMAGHGDRLSKISLACYINKVLKCYYFMKLVKMSAIKQLICLIWVNISCNCCTLSVYFLLKIKSNTEMLLLMNHHL